MSWQKIVKNSDCRVNICKATKCGHNKDLKCSLPEVTISDNGSCLMYTENPLSPSLPEPKYIDTKIYKPKTRGQQSLIDRATKNLNEEKRNR